MSKRSIPATKTARMGIIREILVRSPITSQEQLRQELASLGIETTQATLSRDLEEMHALKVRNAQGAQVYSVPDADGGRTHESEASWARLETWCQDLLIAADTAGNLLVLRTPVGAANLLGSAIDAVRFEGVVGTLAGDDTLLIICRSEENCTEIAQRLLRVAGGKFPRKNE